MALTTCPDCNRQVSTEATACPGCGRPIAGTATARPLFSGSQEALGPQKSRGIYIILGVLLGVLGIHNFYAGYYVRGAVQLAFTVLLGWIGVGLIITGIWVLVELFVISVDARGRPMS